MRHALGFYFNTFHTKNHLYHFYASDQATKPIPNESYLDADNTVQTIIAFERFFELFIKSILRETYIKLTYWSTPPLRDTNIAQEFIQRIRRGNFQAKKDGKKYLTCNFREARGLFFGLVDLTKTNSTDPIVKRFKRILNRMPFMDSPEARSTLHLLSWYRDRILHKGDRLPSLALLDYFISQMVIPLVYKVTEAEKAKLGESTFYFTTVTKINILEKIAELKYEFSDLSKPTLNNENFRNALYLGHLKELGRANLKMNIFVRNNWQATHEYNEKDPKGRGYRFAEVEVNHPNYRKTQACPCCGEKTLVLYRFTIPDIFKKNSLENIDWAKCHLCDYHVRHNVGEPMYFDLHHETIFE